MAAAFRVRAGHRARAAFPPRAAVRTRLALLGSAAALAAAALTPVQLAGAHPAAAAAEQEAAEPQEWVALGDSYTAGVIPAAGRTYEEPRDGCERTDRSYPQLVARDLGPRADVENVSCGAATVANVTDTKQEPMGRHVPPIHRDPDYPFPPVPPQSEAVDGDTDVITVGAGGNTLGFAGILADCLKLGALRGGLGTPCKNKLADEIPARLDTVRRDYDAMLRELRTRAPHAEILAVGYPEVIPEDTAECRYGSLKQFGTVTKGDLAWLRTAVLEPLNGTIEDSVGTLDAARFVDLYASSRGHSVCDADKWVDGLFTRLLPRQPALVHPNARGHRNAADRVEEAARAAVGTAVADR